MPIATGAAGRAGGLGDNGTVAEQREILTVGHSTHPIEEFLALLGGAGVELVADVRRFPGSRRYPQFGVKALRTALAEQGIGYAPFGESLGGRRSSKDVAEGAPLPDNSAWRNASFRAYADYMSDPQFEQGIDRLEAMARERLAAVMCAEGHPSRCHRQLIADLLAARGWGVRHLLPDGSLLPHEVSEHAVVEAGRVHYPGPPEQLEL
jgi:uncharacterized protein (DUF488 family)